MVIVSDLTESDYVSDRVSRSAEKVIDRLTLQSNKGT